MENDEIVLFESRDGVVSLPVSVSADTVWLSQVQMAQLFGKDRTVIWRHIRNAISDGEIVPGSVKIVIYNLEVIIAVGYRVHFPRGVEFRRWATNVLKGYIVHGYAVNHERIRQLGQTIEVIHRAAERVPDMQLRLTVDREENKALALVEDKGVPMPAGNIEIVMKEDKRLQDFSYHDGIITGRFDLGEAWDIPNDSRYGVHISTAVPVDGMGTPETTLATWRQVCSNGAVAEAPLFRTKMVVKDNSGAEAVPDDERAVDGASGRH